jgi:ADP-heptose:LPS heptosyltransferase
VAGLRHFIPVVKPMSPLAPEPGFAASRALARPALDLLARANAAPVASPLLEPRPEDDAAAVSWLERLPDGFLAVHPGSGSPRKNWPATRFGALADRLATGRPFLVVEGPADEAAVTPLRGGRAVVAKDLPLRVLGALLRRARLYVGNDSGVSHLAAAFGAPALVLFGPTSAAVWKPVGMEVQALEAPGGVLEDLDLDTVTSAANEALRSWGRPGLP